MKLRIARKIVKADTAAGVDGSSGYTNGQCTIAGRRVERTKSWRDVEEAWTDYRYAFESLPLGIQGHLRLASGNTAGAFATFLRAEEESRITITAEALLDRMRTLGRLERRVDACEKAHTAGRPVKD